MISNDIKLRIIDALKAQEKFSTDKQLSNYFKINVSQLSRIKKENPELDGVLSDEKWLLIANYFDIDVNGRLQLKIAKTAVFKSLWKKLEFAQANSVSGMIFDRPDIGKTRTAILYTREHKNAVRIHCGRVKTKQLLIRAIAREFGLNSKGRYDEVFDSLVTFLNTTTVPPQVILDEYGDMHYEAYLEHKAIWNETEGRVSWIALGAEGVQKKIERNKNLDKVGFAELYSRMGNRYQRITPLNDDEFKTFQANQIDLIGRANGVKNIQKLIASSFYSLRRIPIEIAKMNNTISETEE